MPHFSVHTGCDTTGPTFGTGLPRIRIRDNPKSTNDRDLKLATPLYPKDWAYIENGDYIMWPVSAIKQLIKYLEQMK